MKHRKPHCVQSALVRILLHGFILNAVWEFVQAELFFTMWQEVSFTTGLFYILLAIFGDVVILWGIMMLTGWICGRDNLYTLNRSACLSMLVTGFIAGLFLEWLPRSFDWWNYNAHMPLIPLFGVTVGLFPVLQMTLLPLLSVYLAIKIQ